MNKNSPWVWFGKEFDDITNFLACRMWVLECKDCELGNALQIIKRRRDADKAAAVHSHGLRVREPCAVLESDWKRVVERSRRLRGERWQNCGGSV